MTDNELVKAEREKELVECLTWLQHRMDEYDDKEAYQDDYKMASIAWNFIRARMAENAELKEAQRWVPVSERLPDNPKLVLTAAWNVVGVARYHGSVKKWIFADAIGIQVTHWQPLPQPPEKG